MSTGIPVALIGHETSGIDVASYLSSAGFDVHVFDAPPRTPDAEWALVWLACLDVPTDEIIKGIRTWLGTQGPSRAVVVTNRPTAFRLALDSHGERLVVLPSPIFGWQLVDALRGVHAVMTPR